MIKKFKKFTSIYFSVSLIVILLVYFIFNDKFSKIYEYSIEINKIVFIKKDFYTQKSRQFITEFENKLKKKKNEVVKEIRFKRNKYYFKSDEKLFEENFNLILIDIKKIINERIKKNKIEFNSLKKEILNNTVFNKYFKDREDRNLLKYSDIKNYINNHFFFPHNKTKDIVFTENFDSILTIERLMNDRLLVNRENISYQEIKLFKDLALNLVTFEEMLKFDYSLLDKIEKNSEINELIIKKRKVSLYLYDYLFIFIFILYLAVIIINRLTRSMLIYIKKNKDFN